MKVEAKIKCLYVIFTVFGGALPIFFYWFGTGDPFTRSIEASFVWATSVVFAGMSVSNPWLHFYIEDIRKEKKHG